jgi:hypothetical protein
MFLVFSCYFFIQKVIDIYLIYSNKYIIYVLLKSHMICFRWSNLVIHHLNRCADMFYSTWYGVYKHIIIGLSSMIHCLYFFFLTTKIYNYSSKCLSLTVSLNSKSLKYFLYFIFFNILKNNINPPWSV